MNMAFPLDDNKLFHKLFMNGGRLSLYGIADIYLFSLFVLPSYFGVRLVFFDLTPFRLFEVLLLWGIFKSQRRRREFIGLVKGIKQTKVILLYTLICVLTNFYHPSINSIFYWLLNNVAVFYCVVYLIQYMYGIPKFIKLIQKYTYIICSINLVGIFIGVSPFTYLNILDKRIAVNGHNGLCLTGPCTESNSFGLYLLILLIFVCIDSDTLKLNVFNKPGLLGLVSASVYFTGGRLPFAILLVELLLFMFFGNRKYVANSLMIFIIGVCLVLMIIMLFSNSVLVQSVLRSFFSAFDSAFGTEYAVMYGANVEEMQNSTYYRQLLFENVWMASWLNPLVGRGGNYQLHLYIQGFNIISMDNYYLTQYVHYAIPGLVSFVCMLLSFLKDMIVEEYRKKRSIIYCLIVGSSFYYLSLWYFDELQTFRYIFVVYAFFIVIKTSINFSR